MKLIILTLSIFLGSISASVIPWPPKQNHFQQKIDHFNFLPNTYQLTYQQTYYYEDKWYEPNGPIFFYCGNEGPIGGFWNNTGFMFEIAPKFKALIIFAEHRYYGNSLPFGNKSFKQPYISYLSIDQALADYVLLISSLKKKFNAENAKVITFGGSYGGMLAGFMRYKYPNIVHGALAASAPMYWVSGQGRFQSFFETITRDYNNVNSSCVAIVKKGFALIQQLLAKGQYAEISRRLSTCNQLSTSAQVYQAMGWLRNGFIMMSMMDYPYAAEFMGKLPASPVNVSCHNMLASQNDPIKALSDAVGVFYQETKGQKCYQPKKLFMECADMTGCGLGPASLAWDFQACTEMNLYDRGKITDASMFPRIPFGYDTVDKYCQAKWNVTRPINHMALMQRPTDVSQITNVIYSNGDLDPWGLGGILPGTKLPKSSVALVVHGGAHHLDLRLSNPKDPLSVRKTRMIEQLYIRYWLKHE